jgi:hemerythrin
MREINETVERVGHTDGVEVPALLNFLRTWYAGHIEGLDQEYGVWLNERGIY